MVCARPPKNVREVVCRRDGCAAVRKSTTLAGRAQRRPEFGNSYGQFAVLERVQGRNVVIAGSALCILAVGIWWLFGHDPDVTPSLRAADTTAPTEPKEAATASSSAVNAATAGTELDGPPPERKEAKVLPKTPARELATIRGRCVDEGGSPMVGCTVHLTGWGANGERTEAWLLEHGSKPQWNDLDDVLTGTDGKFTFEFWPPPPFQFSLDVSHDESVPLSARWAGLKGGATIELGDIKMRAGFEVSGLVTERNQQPVEKELVSLRRASGTTFPNGQMHPRWQLGVRTDAQGRFRFRQLFAPGLYHVSTRNTVLLEPRTVEISPGKSHLQLAIKVQQTPPEQSITGRVLDQAGQPVAGIEVSTPPASFRTWASTTSRKDGTFRLELRTPTEAIATELLVAGSHQLQDKVFETRWGARDVEVRVRASDALTLRITDEAGKAIDSYSVRLVPMSSTVRNSRNTGVRTKGHHQNGTAVIPGLLTGDWMLIVEFVETAASETLFHNFSHVDGASKRLDLVAKESHVRTIRVENLAGEPVADTQVHLLELFGLPLDEKRFIMDQSTWLRNVGKANAMTFAMGTTDDDGRVELRGPGDHMLGLEVRGGPHIPQRQAPISMDEAGELVVRVGQGATLRGTSGPPEALAELRRTAGVAAGTPFARNSQPTLILMRSDGKIFPDQTSSGPGRVGAIQLQDDGTFEATGIPAGRWSIRLRYAIAAAGGHRSDNFTVGEVTLVDGATTEHRLDLSSVIPGKLRALVRQNGEPLANTQVYLTDDKQFVRAITDAQGVFEVDCRAGNYTLKVSDGVHSLGHATVRKRQLTQHTFEVFSGELSLTIVNAAGEPIEGAILQTQPAISFLKPADASGQITIEAAAGQIELFVLPRRLMASDARMKYWQQAIANAATNPDAMNNPFQAVLVRLGTANLLAGEITKKQFVVPPEFDK